MDLKHSFTVNQPMAETWQILTDLERIAPCLPGAQLQEVHGDVFKGVVKVKVGPIVAQFKGDAQFAERNDENYTATLKASGRDTGGKGNASATITAELLSVTPASTMCTVVTDLAITGKVAQFGRGALADISEKLIAQFADNLNALIDAEGGAPKPESESTSAPSNKDDTTSPSEPTIRKIEGPAAEPLNLHDVAGTAMLKRLAPALVGFIVLVWLLRRRR
jgi:carbon monoxide dehydrogenase subunit G